MSYILIYFNMSLQIISNNDSDTHLLNLILKNYFPLPQIAADQSSKMQNFLHVDTKYFRCKIEIKNRQNISNHSLQGIQKADMVIFLMDQYEEVQNIKENIDRWIQVISPEVVVALVNSKNNQEEFQWKYQEQIMQCQTIIPVVYEDLNKILNVLPKWNHSGLLQQHEDQHQIYQILQMIETCSWSTMQKKAIQKKQRKQIQQTGNPQIKKQQKQIKKQNEEKNKQQSLQDELQANEEQMQRQMMQFQLLMQHMMEIKSMPVNTAERKKKAQDIIMKLAKNIDKQ